MDRTHIDDTEESFRVFQQAVIDEYERMVDEFDLVVIDASQSIEDQQIEMRATVTRALGGARKREARAREPLRVLRAWSAGHRGRGAERYPDRGRGRRWRRPSTHIGLLTQWFENAGHAVLDTGMTRSALAGKGLEAATEPLFASSMGA